ncbi:MAG: glycosyltransferase family 4 protein [Proteobacteria bacterium]|nr:glycosyltransferase family 4 protein [Pseudomonadota bacterium]
MPATERRGPRPLRLLQVSAFFRSHGGGIEVVADELARRLPGPDLTVHWMASGTTADRPAEPLPAGLDVEPMRCLDPLERRLGLPMPLWGPCGLLRLWRAVGRADLVHVHDYLYQPSLAAIVFARLRRRPYVVTQHIGEIPFRSPRLRALLAILNRQLGARVLAGAARAVFVGAPVMQYFEQHARFKRPPCLVPNGVDLQRFHPPADRSARSGDLRLLFVGRFVEKKGLPLLRRCLDLPGLHWTFIGWGPVPPAPASTPQVTLAGRLPPDAIVPHYQAADLLVLPSTGEGFPLVVQEALACGTPVLVSREVAQAFPARDEACVFDVDLQGADPLGALRETLSALAADPARLRTARHAARQLAGQWSWQRCVQAYRALYEEALARR